ncbi:mitochondrial carrier [Multifurca ochricompacta]|uniref:Mitochondrial carrier n=1 Tax=Multifurca ochricompacta TaxID=376703 RepID=A0AAD4QPL6_9AGAM|nr:mitochondrial carrier [Multifurca ochricompacta]
MSTLKDAKVVHTSVANEHEPKENGHSPFTQNALIFTAAALGNMFASAITNPLDIIKVRQQLKTQGSPHPLAAPGAKANAFWSVGLQMARTEGLMSLMNGLTASMLRELTYSGIRMGTYEYFKGSIHGLAPSALPTDGLTLKVFAASVAATLGSAVANPTDLVKVRMQAYYPTGPPYRSTRHAFASVWREGGLRALYRGTDATTIRGVVLSVSQICAYDQLKQSLKRRGAMQEGLGLHFTASMFAGFICSVTSNPVDVVKVRVMNDKERRYKSVLDCVRTILRQEGPMAFYKGFSMCWARLGAHTVLCFVAFERIRSLFGIAPM